MQTNCCNWRCRWWTIMPCWLQLHLMLVRETLKMLMNLLHIWSPSFNILCVTTLLLISKTCNLNCVWSLSSLDLLHRWLTLQKTILLQFKMKYNPCTSIPIKSQFWSTLSIILTPILTWMMQFFFLIIEYHVYINDDHKHDSYFVQYCLQKHWTYMVEEGYAPSTCLV